jgi:hypothetical protein
MNVKSETWNGEDVAKKAVGIGFRVMATGEVTERTIKILLDHSNRRVTNFSRETKQNKTKQRNRLLNRHCLEEAPLQASAGQKVCSNDKPHVKI